jgi:hypothetical protein
LRTAYGKRFAVFCGEVAFLVVAASAQPSPAAQDGLLPIRQAQAPMAASGIWSGTVVQVQRSLEYTVVLQLGAHGGEVSYPELNCGGNLTRIGESAGYAFYFETITHGPIDDGRCSDGTITITSIGDQLAWERFGLVRGEVAMAVGLLSRDPHGAQVGGSESTLAEAPSVLGSTGTVPKSLRGKRRSRAFRR